MHITPPYLLFLGDTSDPLSIKTSRGVAQWRPEKCIGEHKLPGGTLTLDLPSMSIKEAAEKGAKTYIIGIANRGGSISTVWITSILEALNNGMDVASGLHQKLADIPEVKETADRLGRQLFDVRHCSRTFDVGTGKKRLGKRLLAVGTDCSVGKMYTCLAIEQELKERGAPTSFCATGQTGILINGTGISVDAVISDFISGAVEAISPATAIDHWTIVEGQGSLFHPSYAGVSLGLLHGSQPDVLIQCLEIGRAHMRGLPHVPQPDLKTCITTNLAAARLTNPEAKLGGISVNSSSVTSAAALDYCKKLALEFDVPCVDPLRHGVTQIVDEILK